MEEKAKEEKGKEESPTSPIENPLSPEPLSIMVSGNHLVTGSGKPVTLHGVGVSTTMWSCLSGAGGTPFEFPTEEADIAAMVAWHINAVRIPLNEEPRRRHNGARTASDLETYREAIQPMFIA